MLASIGLPGLNGFAGEFLLLVGMFQRAWAGPIGPLALYRAVSVLAVFGVVLGAWYMLWLVERVFFGPLREPAVEHGQPSPPIRDLSAREVAGLIPLVVFIVWIGLQPSFFLNRMGPALDRLTAAAVRAADRDGPAGGDRFAETSIAKGDLGGVE